MMSELKIIERKLEVGQWKINITRDGSYGHEIVNVSLQGLRNRPFFLTRISPEVFFTRHPKGPDGKPIDPEVVLRGTPAMYTLYPPLVLLWPAPAHPWVLQIRLRKKVKDAGTDERLEEASSIYPGGDAA
jgi:hypothetical protein